MNVNEYGIYFLFSTGFDMRSSTALSIEFTKPDGTTLTVTNPSVSVGTVDVSVPAPYGTFTAYKYLQYIFANGDVNQAGVWTVRCTYTDANQHLISDEATFTINP